MNQSCCGLAGVLFGHKFKARYDESETYPKEAAKFLESATARITTAGSILLSSDNEALDSIGESFRQISNTESFYVQDVCQRCGLIVDRPPDELEQTDSEALLELIGQRLAESGQLERAQLKDAIQKLVAQSAAQDATCA